MAQVMTRQPISGRYLTERPARKVKPKQKNTPAKRRFAVTDGVLAGTEALHEVSKKHITLCGAPLADDFAVVFERLKTERCSVCADLYVKNDRKRAQQKAQAKKRSAANKSRGRCQPV